MQKQADAALPLVEEPILRNHRVNRVGQEDGCENQKRKNHESKPEMPGSQNQKDHNYEKDC